MCQNGLAGLRKMVPPEPPGLGPFSHDIGLMRRTLHFQRCQLLVPEIKGGSFDQGHCCLRAAVIENLSFGLADGKLDAQNPGRWFFPPLQTQHIFLIEAGDVIVFAPVNIFLVGDQPLQEEAARAGQLIRHIKLIRKIYFAHGKN
jgi:hypothetical protein